VRDCLILKSKLPLLFALFVGVIPLFSWTENKRWFGRSILAVALALLPGPLLMDVQCLALWQSPRLGMLPLLIAGEKHNRFGERMRGGVAMSKTLEALLYADLMLSAIDRRIDKEGGLEPKPCTVPISFIIWDVAGPSTLLLDPATGKMIPRARENKQTKGEPNA